MKKSVLLIVISLAPFILMAQIKSSISGVIGVDYSYRVLKNPLYSGETGRLNYRIGLNYNHKIAEKMWLESGLRFSSIGYNGHKETNAKWGSEFNTTTGIWTPDPTLPHQIQFIYDYLFLEIPIGIRYELKSNKIKTYFAAGLSPNVYLKTRTQTITEFGSKATLGDRIGIQKMTFSANIGFGFEYVLNDHFQVYSQPSFRYHFTPLGTGPIKEYLYNFGLELGIRRNLK
jgi:Outer membrane protein beta-barrel domain